MMFKFCQISLKVLPYLTDFVCVRVMSSAVSLPNHVYWAGLVF